MTWLKWFWIIMSAYLKYGPTLWRLGKEAYQFVEKRAQTKQVAMYGAMTSVQKRNKFIVQLDSLCVRAGLPRLGRRDLYPFLEAVWLRHNFQKKNKLTGDQVIRLASVITKAGA